MTQTGTILRHHPSHRPCFLMLDGVMSFLCIIKEIHVNVCVTVKKKICGILQWNCGKFEESAFSSLLMCYN